MKEVILNNGTKIPSIGVGVFRVEDANIAYETVKTALSVGYRHVDTAMIYGNEEAVGKAIRDSGIPREEIFLTTKLWNDDQRSGKVEEAIEASLKTPEPLPLYLAVPDMLDFIVVYLGGERSRSEKLGRELARALAAEFTRDVYKLSIS